MSYIRNQHPPGLFTADVLGCDTDFFIEKVYDEKTGSVTMKLTTVLPIVGMRGDEVAVFTPPRYPWTNVKEPHA